MIDEEKISKLILLTYHPRFGRLLSEAIENWKNNDPIQHQYGIKSNNKQFFAYEDACCCLISASLINKSDRGPNPEEKVWYSNIHNSLAIEYHLSDDEVSDLISGFDGDRWGKGSEAYNFAREIATILFD